MVFVEDNVRQALAELRRRFEPLCGDRLVGLIRYGPQARGDARFWSDIDALVVLKGEVDDRQEWKRAEELIASVCLEFNLATTPIFMSEEEYLSGDRALHRNIRLEGVAVRSRNRRTCSGARGAVWQPQGSAFRPATRTWRPPPSRLHDVLRRLGAAARGGRVSRQLDGPVLEDETAFPGHSVH